MRPSGVDIVNIWPCRDTIKNVTNVSSVFNWRTLFKFANLDFGLEYLH